MGYTWDNLNIATQTTERWFMLLWSENLETFRIMKILRIAWATNQTLICTHQAQSQRWLVLAYYFNWGLWLPTVEHHCPLLRSQVFVQQQGCRFVLLYIFIFSETIRHRWYLSLHLNILVSRVWHLWFRAKSTPLQNRGRLNIHVHPTDYDNQWSQDRENAAEGWMEFWSSSRGRIDSTKKIPRLRRNKWIFFLQ